ncbi:MAG: hypothetical protein Q7J44_02460 [Pseudotabrizicola sp.]|uniref:hypothetical protein n=1 Tax=Pseudotabrizicola sp. TaxID=2939647 RepID=UPI002715C2CB|nr:hypothetical protein [Pseudotabrizicola sp.]MDO9637384.1 hypothetical protein [Pseudotabrizicola sp.]
MRAALSLTLALGACVQPAPQGAGQGTAVREPLRVTNNGQPFRLYEGAAARRVADATCAAQGRRLRPSIYDRFDAGAWVYVEGCA